MKVNIVYRLPISCLYNKHEQLFKKMFVWSILFKYSNPSWSAIRWDCCHCFINVWSEACGNDEGSEYFLTLQWGNGSAYNSVLIVKIQGHVSKRMVAFTMFSTCAKTVWRDFHICTKENINAGKDGVKVSNGNMF